MILLSALPRSRHSYTRRFVACRSLQQIVQLYPKSAIITDEKFSHILRATSAHDSTSMQRFGVAALLAAAFVATVRAQSIYTTPGLTTSAPLSASTTYTPTNVWAPNPTCSSGSSAVAQNGGYGGGVYRDDYGTYWEVACGNDWSGSTYYDTT
jgi:hypothetical protein